MSFYLPSMTYIFMENYGVNRKTKVSTLKFDLKLSKKESSFYTYEVVNSSYVSLYLLEDQWETSYRNFLLVIYIAYVPTEALGLYIKILVWVILVVLSFLNNIRFNTFEAVMSISVGRSVKEWYLWSGKLSYNIYAILATTYAWRKSQRLSCLVDLATLLCIWNISIQKYAWICKHISTKLTGW